MPPRDPYGHYSGGFDATGTAQLRWHPNDASAETVVHVKEHSPSGLNWGYTGSGPADTALSILTHAARDRDLVDELHQQFKRDVIANLEPNQPFELPGRQVANWLHAHGIEPNGLIPELEPPLVETEPTERRLLDSDNFADEHKRCVDQRLRELAERQRDLDRHQRRLDAQAAALRTALDVEPAWSLPAGPLVAQIRYVQQGTGDQIDIVAKGFGVEDWWAESVLTGKITEVDIEHIQNVCEALHCSPYDLWGVDDARRILHVYGPELWPRFIEPLEPPPLSAQAIEPVEPPGLGPISRRPEGPTLDR
jgi:hypothetical protein